MASSACGHPVHSDHRRFRRLRDWQSRGVRRDIRSDSPRLPQRISQTPPDLVVDHWTSDVESSSPLDFLLLHAMWTPFGCLMSYKIRPIISVACDFTTKSGGIWTTSCGDTNE